MSLVTSAQWRITWFSLCRLELRKFCRSIGVFSKAFLISNSGFLTNETDNRISGA